MIVLLYLLTAMFHIPVTIQISLENPCSDPNNPTCQEYSVIFSREQNDLKTYSAYIAYPRPYKQNTYKKSKTLEKKYKSNTIDDMSSDKLLKGNEKQLWAPIVVPAIIAGTKIIKALINKIGEYRKEKKGK